MDFKLHQLSASNLSSLFNAAYIDAEATDKDDCPFCVLTGEITQIVGAVEELNILRFAHQVHAPKDLKEEDLKKLINAFNEQLPLVKAYVRKNNDGDLLLAFEYDHVVLKHDTISAKTLVQLSRMFESGIESSYAIYNQLFAAQAQ